MSTLALSRDRSEDDFDSWAHHLRCVVMCAQELGLPRADYVAEAVKRGFNANTAGTCWAFVGRQ